LVSDVKKTGETALMINHDNSPVPKNRLSFFTIDVEEYFHLRGVIGNPPLKEWDAYPAKVEENFLTLMDLLSKHNVKATCFFLGYVVRKYPKLVKEAYSRGHEVASHGMYHQLVYEMSPQDFLKDISDSRKLTEDTLGKEISGYRSPCFSVTDRNPWFFEKLVEAGYKFDSSVFPANRTDGGLKTSHLEPHWINTQAGDLFEFPISVTPFCGKNICFFGGGYLRIFPKSVILKMADKIHKQSMPVLYYIHPREIDPTHPRMPVNFKQHFKSYVNLKTVQPKLEAILEHGNFLTCIEYLNKINESKI
jgi:polysaccharide deacetylase family protein (PEP-CTERM system associated)